MADWRALVRERLNGLSLQPVDELSVVEELAQHVEDRFQALCAAGVGDEEARRQSLEEIESETFVAELQELLPPPNDR